MRSRGTPDCLSLWCSKEWLLCVFIWRHGGYIGVPKQSCGSWTLFLYKRFLLLQLKFSFMLVIWVKTLYSINLACSLRFFNSKWIKQLEEIRPTDEGMYWDAGLLRLPVIYFLYSVTVNFWEGRKNCRTVKRIFSCLKRCLLEHFTRVTLY